MDHIFLTLYESKDQKLKISKMVFCDFLHAVFIEVNFSKLTHNNQIFINDFYGLYIKL